MQTNGKFVQQLLSYQDRQEQKVSWMGAQTAFGKLSQA